MKRKVIALILILSAGGVFTFWYLDPFGWIDPLVLYPIYPDTEAAPVLHFYWDDNDITDNINDISPYGTWEGGGGDFYVHGREPNNEIEMRLNYTTPHNIYAHCAGTITRIQGAGTSDNHASVAIRYGRNYGVDYIHLVDLAPGVQVGVTVEPGTLLGKTSLSYDMEDGIGRCFWEISFTKLVNMNLGYMVPPVNYFDAESQQLFDDIRTNCTLTYDSWTKTADPVPGTSADTKGNSFIDEVGEAIWPADLLGMGFFGGGTEYQGTVRNFLSARGILWIIER